MLWLAQHIFLIQITIHTKLAIVYPTIELYISYNIHNIISLG